MYPCVLADMRKGEGMRESVYLLVLAGMREGVGMREGGGMREGVCIRWFWLVVV